MVFESVRRIGHHPVQGLSRKIPLVIVRQVVAETNQQISQVVRQFRLVGSA